RVPPRFPYTTLFRSRNRIMPQQCFKPFRAQSIRVTELGDCGIPPDPADASPGESPGAACAIAVTDSFTSVTGEAEVDEGEEILERKADRKSTRLNSSHVKSSYDVFCLNK